MSKLTKAELIRAIAEETGQSQEVVDKTLAALTHKIIKTVKNGDDVTLSGLGTFKRRETLPAKAATRRLVRALISRPRPPWASNRLRRSRTN